MLQIDWNFFFCNWTIKLVKLNIFDLNWLKKTLKYSHNALLLVTQIGFKIKIEHNLRFNWHLTAIRIQNNFALTDNHIGFENGHITEVAASQVQQKCDFGEWRHDNCVASVRSQMFSQHIHFVLPCHTRERRVVRLDWVLARRFGWIYEIFYFYHAQKFARQLAFPIVPQ